MRVAFWMLGVMLVVLTGLVYGVVLYEVRADS